MTRTEHLLTILAEECNEVAQRVTKALRFGLTEVQSGQSDNNAERMAAEMADLVAVWEMLVDAGLVWPLYCLSDRIHGKKNKIHTYLEYSRTCGTLEGDE